jgi:hypothetical protein
MLQLTIILNTASFYYNLMRMSIQNLKMPLTEEDLIELLKDQKKGYLEIKQELNVTKKGENPLRQMLISLENAGKIEKEVSEDKEYYKIRTLTQAGGEIRSNRAELFIAAAIILVFTFIYANLFLSLKQIPGPMYGGDYYTHYGIINHIYNGNPPWTCPQNQNEYAFYPWLLHFLVAVIGKITGNLLASYILYFPVLVAASSFISLEERYSRTRYYRCCFASAGWEHACSWITYLRTSLPR